ncbi:MAG TPA: hypothetical protein VHI98_15040 [Vicinamibacterales bacterium]|nr:hypothetical protein [Vicinamibacterales bacterium]
MRTIHVRSVALAALASVALTGSAAGQDRSLGLLNAVEVRQLVDRGDPGDHARLSAHFAALGEQYAAVAKRHRSMAQCFAGNPTRSLGTSMRAHCKRLADLNSRSATTVRELAVYHEKAAGGTAGTAPFGGARFEGGAGVSEPTEQELNALAAKARMPAEHRALEEYFLTRAKRYTAEAEVHATLAQAYRGTRIAQAAVHHDRLVALSRDAAKEANEAAAMHKQLAGIAR